MPEVDSFGKPKKQCEFWMCSVWFRPTGDQRFCSRQCKAAESKRRTRRGDRTRLARREQGLAEGYEEGTLYVIYAPAEPPVVKIGYTKALGTRFRALQTANHLDLEILAQRPVKHYRKNDHPDKQLHEDLPEGDHVRGEWWFLTGEVKETLERHELGFGREVG